MRFKSLQQSSKLYSSIEGGHMDEYSRIVIERYCMDHNSAKSRKLERLLALSYDMEEMPGDIDAINLEKLILKEKDPELKEALEDLDNFLFG